MRAIVIDDEKKGHKTIESILELIGSNVELVGHAYGVVEGLKCIRETDPELVFLDVEMEDGTGFDLLNSLSSINFKVIFITAFDKYAVRALRASAIDFLLKPIKSADLKSALDRLSQGIDQEKERIQNLINIHKNKQRIGRIAINSSNRMLFIKADEVVYCNANGPYTYIHLKDGKSFSDSKPLSHYEELLYEERFMRVHRSFLINIECVTEFIKSSEHLIMIDGAKIKMAHAVKHELLERMNLA